MTGVTESKYDNYEEDGDAIGSVNAHAHSVQVRSTTAIVGCALLVISCKPEQIDRMYDPPDPLSVSVRANGLADGQFPPLPSVLLAFDAVHVPASGPWPQINIQVTERVITHARTIILTSFPPESTIGSNPIALQISSRSLSQISRISAYHTE